MQRIVLFGSTGMLGNYIRVVLSKECRVDTINRDSFDVCIDLPEKLHDTINKLNVNADTIFINCIGAIPQKSPDDDVYTKVNQDFPHLINRIRKEYGAKFVHVTTDCVFDGKAGRYDENAKHDATTVYGKTKSKGEPIDCTVIRTSIIGEENSGKRSLLEWVLSQTNKTINGYTNHLWNGVTCYQLAKIIRQMIQENIFWNGVRHIHSPDAISKYELCEQIVKLYGLSTKLVEHVAGDRCDRTLSSIHTSSFDIPPIGQQIIEQRGKIRKVVTITGIRPDFIRMSEIFKKLDANFDHILIHTGQHYNKNLSDVFFEELNIRAPDITLSCGKESTTHYEQTSYLYRVVPPLLKTINPSLVLFLGDSNTAMVSAALKKDGHRIGHIEAGMRSYDKRMLEEINRTICDHCSDILFVYHADYKEQLAKENITKNVFVVGNTIVEPCKQFVGHLTKEVKRNDMILMDVHRPENFKCADRMRDIIRYGNIFANHYKLPIKMLEFHGTSKFIKDNKIDLGCIEMIPLMSFGQYLYTVYHCKFIVSDSGTGQEEPALLRTPVLVPRDYTERPQSYEHNCSRHLAMDKTASSDYLTAIYDWIANFNVKCDPTWLGDGSTSQLILDHLKNFLCAI